MKDSKKKSNRLAAHVHAYNRIKDTILNGELDGSDSIVEFTLASRLGLSRTPVREALRLLEKEGLVLYKEGRGWTIAKISKKDLQEIFSLKILLEPHAAARAAEYANQNDREEILSICKQLLESAKSGNAELWLESGRELHRVILRLANNSRLEMIVNTLNEQWWRIRVGITDLTSKLEAASQQHLAIANAIAEGNPKEAEKAMRKHQEEVYDRVMGALDITFKLRKTA